MMTLSADEIAEVPSPFYNSSCREDQRANQSIREGEKHQFNPSDAIIRNKFICCYSF